jgi:hypothetical protein
MKKQGQDTEVLSTEDLKNQKRLMLQTAELMEDAANALNLHINQQQYESLQEN